eukprot:3744824-Rhodomonas_salina.3
MPLRQSDSTEYQECGVLHFAVGLYECIRNALYCVLISGYMCYAVRSTDMACTPCVQLSLFFMWTRMLHVLSVHREVGPLVPARIPYPPARCDVSGPDITWAWARSLRLRVCGMTYCSSPPYGPYCSSPSVPPCRALRSALLPPDEMSGTGKAYGATPCPVLAYHMVLRRDRY